MRNLSGRRADVALAGSGMVVATDAALASLDLRPAASHLAHNTPLSLRFDPAFVALHALATALGVRSSLDDTGTRQ